MLITDCPWCEGPAAIDTEHGSVDCQGCGVIVELAPEPTAPVMLDAAA